MARPATSRRKPLRVAFVHPDLGLGGECRVFGKRLWSFWGNVGADPHRHRNRANPTSSPQVPNASSSTLLSSWPTVDMM